MNREELWTAFAEHVRVQVQPQTPLKRIFIKDSWDRSRNGGLNLGEGLLHRIQAGELDRRLRQNRPLLQVAEPLLDSFSDHQSIRHVVYITDSDGIVLYSAGDAVWRASQGLMPGFNWSESVMGTNGAGTALVTKHPVAVIGPEHYLEQFHNATCLGAPLHNSQGQVIGAVDFSTSIDKVLPKQLLAVMELAAEIEAALALSDQSASQQQGAGG